MLKKALLFFGWATIVSTTVYEFREGLELINALADLGEGNSQYISSEIKSLFLGVIVGFFQGVGIGLICLFAATKMSER